MFVLKCLSLRPWCEPTLRNGLRVGLDSKAIPPTRWHPQPISILNQQTFPGFWYQLLAPGEARNREPLCYASKPHTEKRAV
ncbi:hypothetical protein ACOMHN_037489 [Nucella lapillus]